MIGGSGTPWVGWTRLLRLGLRGDRLLAPVTVLAFAAIAIAGVTAAASVYPTAADRERVAAAVGRNDVYVFFSGPLRHIGSPAAVANWEAVLFMATAAGICLAMMIVRVTRREEEAGRTELLLAGQTGTLAPLVAALVQGAVAALGLAAASALPLLYGGARVVDVAVVGAQYVTVGLAGIAIALVAAETAASARTANLAAAGLLIGAYFLRAVGDLFPGLGWLRALSPVGWAQAMDPFGANTVLPGLGAPVLLAAAFGLAVGIRGRRDLGAGLLARRRGKTTGPYLSSPGRIVARLNGPTIAVYAAVVAVYAGVVGAILPAIGDLAAGSDLVTEVLAEGAADADITEVFVSVMMSMIGMAAAAGGIALVGRLRAEESSGRAEMLLAGAVSRTRYFTVHSGAVLIGVAGTLVCSAAVLTLAGGVAGAGWVGTGRSAFAAAAVQLPAAVLLAALALALYGVAPRLAVLGWAAVAVAVVCGPFFAPFLGLPEWAMRLSPFSHLPAVPAEPVTATPLIVMTVLAGALFAVGAGAWSRRDVA